MNHSSDDNRVSPSSVSSQDFDVIIVGGGIVGASLACALADSPLQIALVEARTITHQWDDSIYDSRVSAITRASQRIFQRLNVWAGIAAQRVSPYGEMQVWDANGDGHIHFDAADVGEPNLGHIIENRVITKALYDRIEALPSVTLLSPCELTAVQVEADQARLTSADGVRLQGKLLVAADGAQSWLRNQLKFPLKTCHYGHHALVSTVETELPHQGCARQRFLTSGPLAFLPLADSHTSSIVWSTSPEHAQQLLALDDSQFAHALGAAFDYPLGDVTTVSRRASFPLIERHAEDYVAHRVALVGDAAHTIHPLAGQGVNLGLLDMAALAEVVLAATDKGRDFGRLPVLRRYQRWRKGHNQIMSSVMSLFKQLFGSTLTVVQWSRNVALNITNGLGPIKNRIIRLAMGLDGDLPP